MENRSSMDFMAVSGIFFVGCLVARGCQHWYSKTNSDSEEEPSRQICSGVVSWNMPSTVNCDIQESTIVETVDRFWNEKTKTDSKMTPEISVIYLAGLCSDTESSTSKGSSVVYHDSVTYESVSSVQDDSPCRSYNTPFDLHIEPLTSLSQNFVCECCKSKFTKSVSPSDGESIGKPKIQNSSSVSPSTSPSINQSKYWSPRMSLGDVTPKWTPYYKSERIILKKENIASSRRTFGGTSWGLRQKYVERENRRIQELKNNDWVPYSPPISPRKSTSDNMRVIYRKAQQNPTPSERQRSASLGARRMPRSRRITANTSGWQAYSQERRSGSSTSSGKRSPNEQLEISPSYSLGINPQ